MIYRSPQFWIYFRRFQTKTIATEEAMADEKPHITAFTGNTGTHIGDNVVGDQTKNYFGSNPEVHAAIGALDSAVKAAPQDVKAEASKKLEDIKAQVAKGEDNDDGVMSHLLKGL